MGNSQTKEARQQGAPSLAGPATQSGPSTAPITRPDHGIDQISNDRPALTPHLSSGRRGNRHDLMFLGLGNNNDRDVSSLETRRETKQEREARKLEKERAARLKERERSIREEHVDGGYLVTQGVYVGVEDYNKVIVRQLMIERRLAPFWRGLNDFSESWAEHQIVAAARGLKVPPADEVPPELEYRGRFEGPLDTPSPPKPMRSSLQVPLGPLGPPHNPNDSSHQPPSLLSSSSPPDSPATSTPVFRTRAKTLASLSTSSRTGPQAQMTPRELQLPKDPTVNGQQIEVFLYKNSSECPICFLYYPPYLNTTRCCDQPICSECFVQIKRPDPHPPEHEQPDANASAISEAEKEAQLQGQLVSEIATCPFCKQPEFGITYAAPPFRRGLSYSLSIQPFGASSAMSSQTSLSSTGASPNPSRRRGISLSATAPGVITTDKIRPDWASKLAGARAHAARRSAAATALHTAAYLMGGSGQPDPRLFAPFGRRNVLRRQTLEGINGNTGHLDALAILADRHNARQQEQQAEARDDATFNPFLPPPRNSSSRRNRVDELEDMMMMEAIRLSLAAEEDRRKKEEKDAKKEAKKKEKETKKAEKAAKKSGTQNINSNYASTESGPNSPLGRVDSASSSFLEAEPASAGPGKGKGIERTSAGNSSGTQPESPGPSPPVSATQPQDPLSLSPYTTQMSTSEPSRRSHLRQMSNASSSASSYIDASGFDQQGTNTPPGAGGDASTNTNTNTEPMFNFRSLAAMIVDQEKDGGSGLIDHGHGHDDADDGNDAGGGRDTRKSVRASESTTSEGSRNT